MLSNFLLLVQYILGSRKDMWRCICNSREPLSEDRLCNDLPVSSRLDNLLSKQRISFQLSDKIPKNIECINFQPSMSPYISCMNYDMYSLHICHSSLGYNFMYPDRIYRYLTRYKSSNQSNRVDKMTHLDWCNIQKSDNL